MKTHSSINKHRKINAIRGTSQSTFFYMTLLDQRIGFLQRKETNNENHVCPAFIFCTQNIPLPHSRHHTTSSADTINVVCNEQINTQQDSQRTRALSSCKYTNISYQLHMHYANDLPMTTNASSITSHCVSSSFTIGSSSEFYFFFATYSDARRPYNI